MILFPVIKISNLHYASVFNTPINRRLQTMAIAILIFLFLAGAQVTKDDHTVHRLMNSGSYFILGDDGSCSWDIFSIRILGLYVHLFYTLLS